MKLHSIRSEYKFAELSEASIANNPLKQFEHWLNDALNAKVNEPTAMSVATFGTDGFPNSRIVLLKDFNEKGLTFFTNYMSNKGMSITKNPAGLGEKYAYPALSNHGVGTAVDLYFYWDNSINNKHYIVASISYAY